MSFLRATVSRLAVGAGVGPGQHQGFGMNLRNAILRWKQTEAKGKSPAMKFEPGISQSQIQAMHRKPSFTQKLSSEAMEKVSMMFMFTAAFVTFLARFMPHTSQQDNLQAFFQHHTQGFPTRLTSKLKALVEEVMVEMGLNREEIPKVRFFIGTLTDAYAWGTLTSKFGVRLALPEYLNYFKREDVDVGKMRFGSVLSSDPEKTPETLMYSQLEKDEVKRFADHLILSDDAKKFAVAREIERSLTSYNKFYNVIMPGNILFTYIFSKGVNKQFGLLKRPKFFRRLNYAVMASLFSIANVLQQDYVRKLWDAKFDERACRLGPSYAAGGVEFYEKAIQRNIALRTIMPREKGKDVYNRKGEFYPGNQFPVIFISVSTAIAYGFSGALHLITPDDYINANECNETNVTKTQPRTRRKMATERIKNQESQLEFSALDLDPDTVFLLESEMERQKFTKKEKEVLTVFMSDTLEELSFGSTDISKALLGLPKFAFLWKTVDDVQLDKVRHSWHYVPVVSRFFDVCSSLNVNELKKNLSETEIKELKETFVLSLNAKKFLISKYLHEIRDALPTMLQIHGWPFGLVALVAVSKNLNKVYNMLSRPMAVRLAFYAFLLSLVWFMILIMLGSAEEVNYKKFLDSIKDSGDDHLIAGAVEYFEKQSRRAELLKKASNNQFYENNGSLLRTPFCALRKPSLQLPNQLEYFNKASNPELLTEEK